jgi:hypothetical protein
MSVLRKIDLVRRAKQGNRWEVLIIAKHDDNVKTIGTPTYGSLRARCLSQHWGK